MFVAHVHIRVKPEFIDAFIAATIDNASHSIHEPGILRFDFMQDKEHPTRFTLVEAYVDETAPPAHRETAHYLRWRDTVADMMEGERTREIYQAVFPPPEAWAKP